jgi:hypothetical protein
MGRELMRTSGARANPWRQRLLALAVGLALTAAVVSAETIKKTVLTSANPSFLLHNHNGRIELQGWDQNQVDIHGESVSDAMEVIITESEQKVSIQVHPKRERLSPQESRLDFLVRVPRHATVQLDSERGQIVISDLDGSVAVEGISTPVALSRVKGQISIRTVDAPVEIKAAEGHIKVDSIGGDLRFADVKGPELIANTNSGSIRYEGDFGEGGTYVLNNYSSPIDILATARASFDITARAVMGAIDSTLSFRPIPLGSAFRRLSPGKFLQGRVNEGASTVTVTSYSGTIRVRGPQGQTQ